MRRCGISPKTSHRHRCRNYEQLQVKLRGLENTVEDLVQQVRARDRLPGLAVDGLSGRWVCI